MTTPEVSVVIPAYFSHETIASCLETLGSQTFRSFETIVVDSSPDDRCAAIVTRFPEVLYLKHPTRLLPHAARNLGAASARGRLLAFTDPDVSFDPHWLENLTRSHRDSGRIISGAIERSGTRWLDGAVHLCKFSKWLSAGSPRLTDCAPTANMLVARSQYEKIGGFFDDEFLGDLIFSWEAAERGEMPQFEPTAIVFHHHRHGVRSFLAERFERGVLFAGVRTRWHRQQRSTALFYLAVSVLPVRFPRILALVAGQSWRAGLPWFGRYLSTFPVMAAGHAASLAGESVGYARCLLRPAERSVPPPKDPSEAATRRALLRPSSGILGGGRSIAVRRGLLSRPSPQPRVPPGFSEAPDQPQPRR